MLEGRYKSMVHYAQDKLRQIGLRGVFAGWGVSFLRDSFGSGAFFASFELIKSQAYYNFATWYYGNVDEAFVEMHGSMPDENRHPTIRPHYMLEPAFILGAGVTASVAQQSIQYPLSRVQDVHYARLESLDHAAKLDSPRSQLMRLYYNAYQETLNQCHRLAKRAGGWRRWLYQGFLLNTIRQIPSTSAGLVVFEVVRRRYATDKDTVRIEKDGYDILLT